jgi:Uma2 family endonuclease
MNARPQDRAGRYTVADYLTWPDDERWELIDGIAYAMAPAPTTKHQGIAGRLYSRLEQRLNGKPCRPFIAPVDVVLSEGDVVQPDVFVVCDPAKITEKNIQGAPDLVVEVLSPTTATRDLREKKALYMCAGVLEYVVVDPLELYVQRFRLDENGRYGAGDIFAPREELPLATLDGCVVPLWEIFELPAPGEDGGEAGAAP